jgi:hypothetical protein
MALMRQAVWGRKALGVSLWGCCDGDGCLGEGEGEREGYSAGGLA